MKSRRNLNRKPRPDAPAGLFRACDRCWVTTDHGAQIEQFTDCAICRGAWLCSSCADYHHASSIFFGSTS